MIDNPDTPQQPQYNPPDGIERRDVLTPEEISVRGPGGIGFTVRGQSQQVLLILLFMVTAGAIFWMQYQHALDEKASKNEMVLAIKSLVESQDETSYMISLSQEQRQKLDMNMPASLRKKLRERDR